MTDLAVFTIEERHGACVLDRQVAGRETVRKTTDLLTAGDHAHDTYTANKSAYKSRSERKAAYNVVVWVGGQPIILIDYKGTHTGAAARARSDHHRKFY